MTLPIAIGKIAVESSVEVMTVKKRMVVDRRGKVCS